MVFNVFRAVSRDVGGIRCRLVCVAEPMLGLLALDNGLSGSICVRSRLVGPEQRGCGLPLGHPPCRLVGMSLVGIVCFPHAVLKLGANPLLYHMGQFVRQEAASFWAGRFVKTSSKDDMSTLGEGEGVQGRRRLSRTCIRVNTHPAEVMAEA